MKRTFFGAAAGIVLTAAIGSSAAAADLTVDYGSTGTPYDAAGIFQIVEAGNPFSDTPRVVVNDLGGSLSGSGSAAPITTSDFTIDLLFTTLSPSEFTGTFSSAIPDTSPGFDLFEGSALKASGTAGSGGLSIAPITIGPGAYTLELTGVVDSSLEAEGTFGFAGGNVAAAPEPATWAMMLLGIGAIGGHLRGKRWRAAALTA